jgi:class 3 adenylate cyclase/YHS domain-containing protein
MHHPVVDREPSSATFLFADIAGFTALTEVHGDEEAAMVVARFCEAVTRELPAFGAAHVKTIGDALMLRIPDPAQAVLLGLRIALDLLRGHRAPAVRVGLHHGPAIERDGDYFGGTVNLAARVSAAATGGEVLLTGQTAALAQNVEGVRYESRGSSALRNIRDPVELVAAVRHGQTRELRFAIDPVCRMAVDPEHAAGRLVIDDTAYFFCSVACAGVFARQPERFVD